MARLEITDPNEGDTWSGYISADFYDDEGDLQMNVNMTPETFDELAEEVVTLLDEFGIVDASVVDGRRDQPEPPHL